MLLYSYYDYISCLLFKYSNLNLPSETPGESCFLLKLHKFNFSRYQPEVNEN